MDVPILNDLEDEELLDQYLEVLENLERAGVSIAEAVGDVVAPGGIPEDENPKQEGFLEKCLRELADIVSSISEESVTGF